MQVIAQDQSEAQLQSASCDKANIEHQCARAEETGLPNACADLVTTAQALHWCAPHLHHHQPSTGVYAADHL